MRQPTALEGPGRGVVEQRGGEWGGGVGGREGGRERALDSLGLGRAGVPSSGALAASGAASGLLPIPGPCM